MDVLYDEPDICWVINSGVHSVIMSPAWDWPCYRVFENACYGAFVRSPVSLKTPLWVEYNYKLPVRSTRLGIVKCFKVGDLVNPPKDWSCSIFRSYHSSPENFGVAPNVLAFPVTTVYFRHLVALDQAVWNPWSRSKEALTFSFSR